MFKTKKKNLSLIGRMRKELSVNIPMRYPRFSLLWLFLSSCKSFIDFSIIFFCISPTLLYIIYPLVSHHSILTGSNAIIYFCYSRNFISNFLSVLLYLYPLYSCSWNFWNPFLYIYLQFPKQLCRKKSIRRRRRKEKKFYCTLRDFSRVYLW